MWVVTITTLLITPLITTHEPPSSLSKGSADFVRIDKGFYWRPLPRLRLRRRSPAAAVTRRRASQLRRRRWTGMLRRATAMTAQRWTSWKRRRRKSSTQCALFCAPAAPSAAERSGRIPTPPLAGVTPKFRNSKRCIGQWRYERAELHKSKHYRYAGFLPLGMQSAIHKRGHHRHDHLSLRHHIHHYPHHSQHHLHLHQQPQR